MTDFPSFESSSNISVEPEYLLGNSLQNRTSDINLYAVGSPEYLSARSFVEMGNSKSNEPFGQSEENGNGNMANAAEMRNVQQPNMWNTIQGKVASVIRSTAHGADRLLDMMIEPHYRTANSPHENKLLQVVKMNEMNEAFSASAQVAHLAMEDEEEEEEEEEDVVAYQRTAIKAIELVSTLRAYRSKPSDCYGHLVAAALTDKSKENPVTGAELVEAGRNPYLVRMVIDSHCLDLEDELVRREIQGCVDALIPSEASRVPRSVYEYLPSLLRLNFVRLSPEQYEVMKGSGFEFLKLLYDNPHVLPPIRVNCIHANYMRTSWCFDFFAMILNMLLEIFCIVSTVLVLTHWVGGNANENHDNFAYYTAIVYGIGYGAHLIGMIFLMRGKVMNVVYGKMLCSFPSPHLLVVPVVPLYNFVSIGTYIRYRRINRGGKYIAILHDIVAAQVLSSICFSFCIAMPQLIYQSLVSVDFDIITVSDPSYNFFRLLAISTILTTVVSVLRMFRALAMFDSINCFGFSCFGFQSNRIIERHSAVVRMIYVSCLFLFELNQPFLVLGAMSVKDCKGRALATITLTGVSILNLLVLFFLLLLSHESVFRLMWALLPLTLLQIVLVIYQNRAFAEKCAFLLALNGTALLFRFVIWVMFFFFLALWVMQSIVLLVRKKLRGLTTR